MESYELTEDEVTLLLEALDLWRTDGKFWTDEEVDRFELLYYYLKIRGGKLSDKRRL